ncbi:MAG: hypothetical protein ACR2N6_04400 [Miltoncostaeaceae bacterium]
MAEALRHAQGVIHRDIQTGMIIAAAERQDRAKAEKLPEAEEAEEWNPERDSGEHPSGRDERPEPEEGEPGALIDLEA